MSLNKFAAVFLSSIKPLQHLDNFATSLPWVYLAHLVAPDRVIEKGAHCMLELLLRDCFFFLIRRKA